MTLNLPEIDISLTFLTSNLIKTMKTRILSAAFFAAMLISCGGNKPAETSKSDTTAIDAVQKATPAELNLAGDVVCIWEGVPVYEEPNKKSKWMASIALGETVKYLDETQTDAADNNKEYYKVELYDGKKGWSPSYGLIRDAKLGAVIGELAIVYKRPQLAAISDKKLPFMEIVAVGKSEGDFVEVFGAKKAVSGWVKKGDITTQDNDVTTAVLAMKMIPADAKGEALESKLKELMAAAPKDSPFYVRLNEKYNDLVATREQAATAGDTTGDN
jgi:hypothetical protein